MCTFIWSDLQSSQQLNMFNCYNQQGKPFLDFQNAPMNLKVKNNDLKKRL